MSKNIEMVDEMESIFIPDEEGNEIEFEVIMRFEPDDSDHKYMIVVRVETEEDEDEEEEAIAFRYEEDGEELILFQIEDEAEWDMVEETYNTLMMELEEEEG